MAQISSSKSSSSTVTKKKIRVHKRPSATSSSSSSNEIPEDSDYYTPLAARDSIWVGLTFYNPNFQLPGGDEEADEEEIQIMDVDDEELPIYTLFPSLKEKFLKRKSFTSDNESTTDITKLLVGQKADFTLMKKSKKCTPIKLSLPSLKEIPNEEKAEEDSDKNYATSSGMTNTSEVKSKKLYADKKQNKRIPQPSVSRTSREYEDNDSDKTRKDIKRKKRIKKKTDIPTNLDSESSYSGLNQSTKRPLNKENVLNLLKPAKRYRKQQKITRQSSHGSLADDESV